MKPKRRTASIPVRWQPYAELAAASALACGGAGEGRRDGIVERNLLSQFKGEANQQVTYDRAELSVTLSLRVGSQEEPQPQNRLQFRSAPTRQSPRLLRAGSSAPPPQMYAPSGSSPAVAGLAPPQLGSNSLQQLQLPLAGATPPQPQCGGVCNLHYDRLAADLLRRVSEDLDRRVGLLRQELSAEVRKEVLRLHAAAAAAAAAGIPLPAAAFSAAGLPQPPQPCGGGAWCWCPGCGARPGAVAFEPYEHLCLCAQCLHDASRVCLVCSFTSTGASRGRGRGGSLPPWP